MANKDAIEGSSETPAHSVEADELFPADLVAELARTATLVPVVHPGDAAAECRYTPSQRLADFVRCRDLTYRFPGCDRPAIGCDVDHTIPYTQGGPTQTSNLKCLCRIHHLMKTSGTQATSSFVSGGRGRRRSRRYGSKRPRRQFRRAVEC